MGTRNQQRGDQALADLLASSPECQGKIEVVLVDVSNADSVKDAAAALSAKLGEEKLYALVNNAGILHPDQVPAMVQTNLLGTRSMCDSFIPLLHPT